MPMAGRESGKTTILIADDDLVNRSVIERQLARAGYRVLATSDGKEAVETAKMTIPDLILLDVMMPVMDGLEACRMLKEDSSTRDIPVIFLSARGDTQLKVSGLGLGANDYINKPFESEELLARVEVALRMKHDRDHLKQNVAEAEAIAELAIERAMTDALTGLYNRHGLQRILARGHAEARRYSRPLSCLMLDLDRFKLINDTYGHAVGDIGLLQTARNLTDIVRRSDLVFRLGGEEFLVLLPETNLQGAMSLGEKIRQAIENHAFGDSENTFTMTISAGVAELSESESGNDMIARADMALYSAKRCGRNRVEAA
jgi:diguanylate cyclase (GGDEF)-like protein